ncbi:hypothetical protein Nepgr_032516 [Nepenthes gracilis]|uniref:Uncharacterized protein n=1 Tax=Nepenthes gracilis TaxID=150966 RepID=A0AAD3Y640_NEPGR|nr:hypothetical protein Nepgr_032516 [Nepenthes gracilis]
MAAQWDLKLTLFAISFYSELLCNTKDSLSSSCLPSRFSASHFCFVIAAMEVGGYSLEVGKIMVFSMMKAVLTDTLLLAGKSLACLLMMTGSLKNDSNYSSAELNPVEKRFPIDELYRTQPTVPENKDGSDTDDGDEDDDEDGVDDDDDDVGDEDFSAEEGGGGDDDDEDGDPEDDTRLMERGGNDDEDDDDDNDGDEDENGEDEDEDEDEDEEEEELQPPAKKKK